MTRPFKITDAQSGAAFTVRVVTRANKTEIAGIQEDGTLKVRLTAGPGDGGANQQLVEFLAERLGVEPHDIEIVAGENSRDKLISVSGVSPSELEERLRPDPDAEA
jgi:uncharacterized protein (TIGR00251 family)